MSKKTRKDAAAEIRKLRKENAILKREVGAHLFDSTIARNEKEKHLGRIATLESKVAKYKNLLDEAMALCANVIKEADKAVAAAEKYRAKAKRWRFYFFTELAGVVIGVAIGLFLK